MPGEWIRKPPGEASVVFVHGILSGRETCWKHDNGSYWPELLKNESKLASLGIWVFSYQTGIFSGSYSLGDIVDHLKEHMQLDGVIQCKRLIFVCHSMGGIVVRKFIVERAAELIGSEKEIELFLVASPSLGSSYANWFSPLAQVLGHTQADALRFVRHNVWLQDLDKQFKNLKEHGELKLKGKELVEDKFVYLGRFWRKQVVEPFEGAVYFGEPYKVPKSDHFSIAKPCDKNADQHRLLCRFILNNALLPGTEVRRVAHAPWPKEPMSFDHRLADREEWLAIQKLMTVDAEKRILILKGPSGYSKTALLNAAGHYANLLGVPSAYVDFKDSQFLNQTDVLHRLRVDLGVVLPGCTEPGPWKMLKALRELGSPALILLDSYEKITETKELVRWIEAQLLVELAQCNQLRVLIAGQRVLEDEYARWRDIAVEFELRKIEDKEVWKKWMERINPHVVDKTVDDFVDGLEGVPGTISTALKTLAKKVLPTG